MRAVIVYESMYGNTHEVAVGIAEGLRNTFSGVDVVPVEAASRELVDAADLLVVGGPTHVHGMTSARSRDAAVQAAVKDDDLVLDEDAPGPGLRGWFDTIEAHGATAVAFDTRIDAPAVFTGRASRGIARRLRRHGFDELRSPESFLVDKHNHLLDGEADRAAAWGKRVAEDFATTRSDRAPTSG